MAAFRTACTSWETAIEMEGNANDSNQVALQSHKLSCNTFSLLQPVIQTTHQNWANSVACIIRTQFRNTGRWALPDVLKYAVFQKTVTFSPPFRSVFGLWDVSHSACGLVRRLAGSQVPWRLQAFEEGWAARPSSNHPAGLWGITDVRGERCEWHSNAPAVKILAVLARRKRHRQTGVLEL